MANTRTIEINPTCLTPSQAKLLNEFLLESRGQSQGVWFQGNKYPHVSSDGNPVFIKLTHHLVHRIRSNPVTRTTEDRYSVFLNGEHKPEKGTFGTVYQVQGTLKPVHNKGLVYDRHKQRVIKVIDYASNTQKNDCLREANISLEMPHLHAKPATMTDRQAYIVMRKFPGRTLEQLLEDNRNTLTVLDRLHLSIRLINSLQTQVHFRKKVHRDIKPGNIMVSLREGEVNIIDFGFSVFANDKDYSRCGTPGFVAPEAYFDKPSLGKASDVFSMGMVLAYLWGGRCRDQEQYSTDFIGLFNGITVFETEKQQIGLALKSLIHPKPERRASLKDAAKVFINLFAMRYQHMYARQFSVEQVHDAYMVGNHLDISLQQLDKRDFSATCKHIVDHIQHLEDMPELLQVFHLSHQLNSLKRHNSKANMIDYVVGAERRFEHVIDELRYLIAQGKGVIKSIQDCNDTKMQQASEYALAQLSEQVSRLALLEHKLMKRQPDFEKVAQLMSSLTVDLPVYTKQFKEMLALVNQKRTKTQFVERRLEAMRASPNGGDIKKQTVMMLQEYMSSRQNGIVFGLLKQSVPEDRLQVINEVLDIVESDIEQRVLARHIGDRLQTLRTGWLFSSGLEAKLTALLQPTTSQSVAINSSI